MTQIAQSDQTVSNKTLVKSVFAAGVMGIAVILLFVLPAEYNMDPTGLGHKMGLTKLSPGAVNASSNLEPAEGGQSDGIATNQGSSDFQVIEITIPAGAGLEYKFQMAQFSKLHYEWLTDGDSLYFDLHGEPEGDTTEYFESYAVATVDEMKGSFTAPFTGSHGWYWQNNSNQDIAVQLMVKGEYQVLGIK